MRTAATTLTLLLATTVPSQETPGPRKLATIPEDLAMTTTVTGPDGTKHETSTRFAFGAGGTFVAYTAWRSGKSVAMVGAKELGEFDYLHPPVMDVTASHYAFRAGNRIAPKKEKWWAIVDGEKGRPYDWIGAVAVSSRGTAAFWEQPGARIVSSGAYNNSSMVLHTGKRKGKKFQQTLSLVEPTFSADGKTVATSALRSSQWFALTATTRKEKVGKDGYPAVEDAVISPDGKNVALVVVVGGMPLPPGVPPPPGVEAGKQRVALGGKLLGEDTDGAGVPVFAPGSKRLAFKFVLGERMGIARDDDKKVQATHDFVGTPVWDGKGKSFAFAANEGGEVEAQARLRSFGDQGVRGGTWSVWLREGKKAPEAVVEGMSAVARLAFGPRGELAYARRDEGRWHVVTGEHRSDGFDEVGALHWSADGKKIEFGARKDRELLWCVLPLE